jgi:muconolactone delta-isomerase
MPHDNGPLRSPPAALTGAGGEPKIGVPSNQKEGGEAMLYFLDFHVEYPATMSQKDLFQIWAREADAAIGAKKAGAVVDLWKCVGQRRVLAIVNIDSPDILDQILMDLPIMKEHGQHVRIDLVPLRRYEDFAADVKKRL